VVSLTVTGLKAVVVDEDTKVFDGRRAIRALVLSETQVSRAYKLQVNSLDLLRLFTPDISRIK